MQLRLRRLSKTIYLTNSFYNSKSTMEFHECFTLLTTRPVHAHEHCKEEQDIYETNQDMNVSVDYAQSSPNQAQDLMLQSCRELVKTFNRLQEMRVQIYADFQQGFQVYKKTQEFPAFCSGIKNRLSAVSEQVNRIEKLLRDEKHQVAIAKLLRKIQIEEKEKLLLTSAILIENMRLSDEAKQVEPDTSTIAFLERSIEILTTKHTDCVVRINEILEELRVELADLEDA
ncbi:unnamed protein product [Peronospora belbahrii]|uniref:Uncharacterized protein n=1 Tax=Peronospora belbahrii TaxID=622444 RepID=A0AAU9KIB0_9STRA|nr:unnamed protein product [Peronospora belbahrii]CAH0520566.1 unnamed protein product [Peronospora belbahrii]